MNKRKLFRDYAGITVGCVLTAVGLDLFLIPNKIVDGGVSGAAIVLHYLFGWPVGVTMLALNIPLFLVGIKVLGARFGLNTLYGAVVLSLAIDLLAPHLPFLTSNMLLNTIYGGVMCGIGIGLALKFNGTTAGTDLLAAIINKLFHVSVGKALLAIDFVVIATAGIVFRSAEAAMYALIALFVATQIIDLVQEGRSDAKAFFIISACSERIADEVMRTLSRGVTLFPARGGYTGAEKDVLLCVVGAREITLMKEIVYQIDKKAFVIVADAHEVLGEGFHTAGDAP